MWVAKPPLLEGQSTLKASIETLRRWKKHPPSMVKEMFKINLDDFQDEALCIFADPEKQRIALKACVGPGKTLTEVMAALNLMVCYGGEDPKEHPQAAAVSITGDNLRDNFWKELSLWYQQSDILKSTFEMTAERFYHRRFKDSWFISARTFRQKASREQIGRTLSGLHSKSIAYFLDESGQMPIEILLAAEQGLSNCKFGKILTAGNPMAVGPEWLLWMVCHKLRATSENPNGFHVLTVNNDPENPRKSVLPNWESTLKWCRQMIKDWGRDNPWVKYAVFGEFPPSSFNTLIGPEAVEEAMARQLAHNAYSFMQKRGGLDVAFQGDDMSVFALRQGLQWFEAEKIRLDLTSRTFSLDIAARVMEKARVFNPEVIYVDATGGYGDGALSAINQHKYYNAVGIQFSGSATNKRFYNKRTEMWWDAIDAIKSGAALPKECPELVTGFSTATYTLKNGLFLLEPKEIMKARLGRSPDTEDAYCLTYAQPDCPAAEEAKEIRATRAAHPPAGYRNPAMGQNKNRPGYKNPAR